MDHLRPNTLEQVLALAELPDMIRGYESIKETNITRFSTEADKLLASLESAPIQNERAGSIAPSDHSCSAKKARPTRLASGRPSHSLNCAWTATKRSRSTPVS